MNWRGKVSLDTLYGSVKVKAVMICLTPQLGLEILTIMVITF